MIVATITADEPITTDGRTRYHATIEIDLVVDHDIDMLARTEQLTARLPARLLSAWQVDDLADVVDFHREVAG